MSTIPVVLIWRATTQFPVNLFLVGYNLYWEHPILCRQFPCLSNISGFVRMYLIFAVCLLLLNVFLHLKCKCMLMQLVQTDV